MKHYEQPKVKLDFHEPEDVVTTSPTNINYDEVFGDYYVSDPFSGGAV